MNKTDRSVTQVFNILELLATVDQNGALLQ